MDDMKTFEQRVAGEVIRVMGPSEPVDDFVKKGGLLAVGLHEHDVALFVDDRHGNPWHAYS